MQIQTLDIPFVPSAPDRLAAMLELANIKPRQRTVDLGAGDGRVVIACAKLGAEAHGYELSPERVQLATHNIKMEKLAGLALIHHQSFWDANLQNFQIVTLYGITGMMERLERKLTGELPPGVKIVSNAFRFPNWKPIAAKNSVYLYVST